MTIRELEDLWIMNAAGMVKTTGDVGALLTAALTHIVLGSITVEPRHGNPAPNFWLSPDGRYALNARGLPGPGLEYYAVHLPLIAAEVRAAGKELVVSITSTKSEDDWKLLANACRDADALEINLSCPNKWRDGVNERVIAEDPALVARILDDVQAEAPLTDLWVKLPPYQNPESNTVLAEICAAIGERDCVNAVVSCNTHGGHAPPRGPDGAPVISMPAAGKSGRWLRNWSLAQNRAVDRMLRHVPRIGVGGIYTGRDLEDYRLAGVRGVQIGTAFFQYGPRIFSDVLQEVA